MGTLTAHKLPRKPCGNPECPKTIPATWHFCKDRTCQQTRHHVEGTEVAVRAQQLARAKMYRRVYERHLDWANGRRAGERRRLARNAEIIRRRKAAELEHVRKYGDPELRQLLAEQERDNNYLRRTKGDPWRLCSLDDLYSQGRDPVRRRSGVEWSDPVGEFAASYVDAQLGRLAEW